jgi:hypothetical protein
MMATSTAQEFFEVDVHALNAAAATVGPAEEHFEWVRGS